MDADSLIWLVAVPPDTMPIIAGVAEPIGYVLGGMLWYFLISTAVVFVIFAAVDWQRARAQGRRWPWD